MSIYFDNAASTKILDIFKDDLVKIYGMYGNPSSTHSLGKKSRYEIEKAREYIAKSLNISSRDLIFTSGATESTNLIIKGIAEKKGKGHIITTSVEHPSVLNVCKYLESKGFKVTYIKPDKNGNISVEDIKNSIEEDTFLVSIMAINNETGKMFPIKEIANILKDKNIYFHSDIVQYLMKERIDIKELGIDAFSASFHKFHGPKGLGLCYINSNIPYTKQIHGGEHEMNKRSGTENLNSIILGFEVYKYMDENIEKHRKKLDDLMKYCISKLDVLGDKIIINSKGINILNVQIVGKDIQYILPLLDMEGVCVSGGSACQSKSVRASKVLLEQGLSTEEAMSSIRISFSVENNFDEIDSFIDILKKII